jgi:hypothetical protein
MIRIIDTFSPGANFWAMHPQFLAVNPFKDMYERDESANKVESSLLMWFVVLCYDMDSKYEGLPTNEKHLMIGEDFCNDSEYFDRFAALIVPCRDMYCKMQDTPAKRSLRNWKNTLEDRDNFLASSTYTLDSYDDRGKIKKGTADQIDAMHGRTPKFWSDYERIMEALSKEESGGTGEAKGGAMPSASDEGDI